MHARLTLIAAFTFLAACASGPQAAPGTQPGDMSPEGHRNAAAEQESEAAIDEHEAEQAPKLTEQQAYEREAAKHHEAAEQHEEAAEQAEGAK
jgi:hypothetical protein